MIDISYGSIKELDKLSARDAFAFMSYLLGNFIPAGTKNIYVTEFTETPDEVMKTMIHVLIKFQYSDKAGKNIESGEYNCYRAKNFCCSSATIEKTSKPKRNLPEGRIVNGRRQ